MESIRAASYEGIRAELHALRQCIERKRNHRSNIDINMWRIQKGQTIGISSWGNKCVLLKFLLDIVELPLCEVSLSCDNLLCDGHGRPPNPTLVIDVFMPSMKVWVHYARTEIVEV